MTLNTGEHTLDATSKRKTIRDGPRELQGTPRKWYRPHYVDKATQTDRRACSFEDTGVQTTLHPVTIIELQHQTSPLKPTDLIHKSPGRSGRGTDSRRTFPSHGETLKSVAHVRITPGQLANSNDVEAQLLPHAPSHSPSQAHSAIVSELRVASFSTPAAEGDCREPAPLLSTNHEHRYGGASISRAGLLEPCPTLNFSSGAGDPHTVLPARDLPGDAETPSTRGPVAGLRDVTEELDDVLRATAHTLPISPSSVPRLQVESAPAHDRGGATLTKDTPVEPPTGAAYSAADGSTLASNKQTTLLDDEYILDAGSETSEHYADLAPEMAFFLDISSPPAFETTFLRDEVKDDDAMLVAGTAHVPKPNGARALVDENREAYGGPLADTYEDSQDGCAFATSRDIVACALAGVNGDALLFGDRVYGPVTP
ncbi:hypothetical protein EXIGLDRAFT_702756 [Exidia glandulosa HHB12029]|uniref:Uncharacterized protein n=1 Tax=Exidia glandulosa HHB12029 TaxID=1314781 RepID=A0A165CDK9_EXIGL|nr:hypothetical protein EXIGLDRAFT_702756 [Exidia glandulosa HHB12029]